MFPAPTKPSFMGGTLFGVRHGPRYPRYFFFFLHFFFLADCAALLCFLDFLHFFFVGALGVGLGPGAGVSSYWTSALKNISWEVKSSSNPDGEPSGTSAGLKLAKVDPEAMDLPEIAPSSMALSGTSMPTRSPAWIGRFAENVCTPALDTTCVLMPAPR